MPASRLVARALVAVALLLVTGSVSAPDVRRSVPRSAPAAPPVQALDRLPLAFEPLPGDQADPAFVTSGLGYRAVLGAGGAAIVTTPNDQIRMALGGGAVRSAGEGRDRQAGVANFLVGPDPARWRHGVPRFGAVVYDGVYPGIDLVYHGQRRNLEYDFVLAPGVGPEAIDVVLEGGGTPTVDGEGDLVLSGAGLRMEKPFVYQEVGHSRRPVEGRFLLREPGHVGFEIGPHDPSLPVVIDPELVSSTYLGGTGIDSSYGVALDRRGNVYVTGYTESSDFQTASPVQPGLKEGLGLRTDAFVAKLDPAGTELLYATYFGGGDRDTGRSVAVGTDGAAYVVGTTESPDFPTTRPAQAAYGGGTSDAFLVKLNPEGTAVDYATTIGGSSLDEGNGVAVDAGGSAFVTGSTTSTNFPTEAAVQDRPGGEVDAFVTRVSADGGGFTYSTYLGGAADEHGRGLALDRAGGAYVTGDTSSVNFPAVRPFQPRFGGVGDQAGRGPDVAGDAFLTRLEPSGSSLAFSTYLGGNDSDSAAGIALDDEGTVYLTGNTGSPNFPLAKAQQPRKAGDFDAFVTALKGDGSELVYSTFLGGSSSDGATSIAVDSDRRAAVVGATSSSDFPVVDALQNAKVGGFVDGFVAGYGSGGEVELASYFGGGDEDQATGVAVDADGTMHIAGYTNSGNFPTAQPFRATKAGSVGDAFLSAVSPTSAAGGSSASSRSQLLLALTLGLLAIAVALTVWLRRHPEPADGPPLPPLAPPDRGERAEPPSPPVPAAGGDRRPLPRERPERPQRAARPSRPRFEQPVATGGMSPVGRSPSAPPTDRGETAPTRPVSGAGRPPASPGPGEAGWLWGRAPTAPANPAPFTPPGGALPEPSISAGDVSGPPDPARPPAPFTPPGGLARPAVPRQSRPSTPAPSPARRSRPSFVPPEPPPTGPVPPAPPPAGAPSPPLPPRPAERPMAPPPPPPPAPTPPPVAPTPAPMPPPTPAPPVVPSPPPEPSVPPPPVPSPAPEPPPAPPPVEPEPAPTAPASEAQEPSVPVPDILPAGHEDLGPPAEATGRDLWADLSAPPEPPVAPVDPSRPDLWGPSEPIPDLAANELAAWELLISSPAPVDFEDEGGASASKPPVEDAPAESGTDRPPGNGGSDPGVSRPSEPAPDFWAEDLPITPSSEVGSGDEWLRLLWSEDPPLPDDRRDEKDGGTAPAPEQPEAGKPE